MNCVSRRISRYFNNRKLDAPYETEAIIFKERRRREGNSFCIEYVQITLQKQVKYLGIWLDEKPSFKHYIKQTKMKAEAAVAAITRVMPNIGRLLYAKRKVLAGVIKSIVMNGASIW